MAKSQDKDFIVIEGAVHGLLVALLMSIARARLEDTRMRGKTSLITSRSGSTIDFNISGQQWRHSCLNVHSISTFFGLISAVFVSQAVAQTAVMKQFFPFSGGAQGLYWVPSSGPISHIAFLVIHRTSNFRAKPRFRCQSVDSVFWGWLRGSRVTGAVQLGNSCADVRAGVRFLRSQPGITRVADRAQRRRRGDVVYQAVAENGLAFCQAPNKLTQSSAASSLDLSRLTEPTDLSFWTPP